MTAHDGYYSAQEIGDMNLPGLTSKGKPDARKRFVIRYAQENGWVVKDRWGRWQPVVDNCGRELSRKRDGKGGGFEYHYALFPKEAFDAFIHDETTNVVKTYDIEKTVAFDFKKADAYKSLNDWQRSVLAARCGILNYLDEQHLNQGSKQAAIDDFITKCKAGTLPLELRELVMKANAKSGKQSGKPKLTISERTIKNWYAAKNKDGVEGLTPGLSKETDYTIPEWAWALLELYRQPNKPVLAGCVQELPKYLPAGVKAPTYDAARLFIKKLDKVTQNKGRMGPQALKSMKAFTRRGFEELWPTAIFSSDGHSFKATVEHPHHGQPFGPEVTAVIDIYTRYVTGWSVGLSENSIGVLESMAVSIIEHDDGRHRGLPAIWYTDNGSGFRAKMFEDVDTGFYDRWGITAKNSLPRNPQARGVIERLNASLWTPLEKTFKTYRGKDVDPDALRQVKRITDKALRAGRKAPFMVTWDEFKQLIQQAIDSYNNRPHSSLPRVRDPETLRYRHLSPKEVWDKWLAEGGQNTLIPKEEAADLMRPYERRKISRGEVQILGNIYFSFDLEPFHGEWAHVGYDIHDAKQVWVRDLKGNLLAIAELDGNKQQYFSDGVFREALSKQDQIFNNRIKNRLKTAQNRVDEIEQEAKGAPLEIEYRETEQAPILTLDAQERAEAELAKIQKAAEPVKMVSSTGRPIFSDDVSWGKWLSENPTQATSMDVEELQSKLKSDIFRMQMKFEGVVLDTLKEIAAKRAAV